MEHACVSIGDIEVDVYRVNTAVVGTGAAGLNAADSLFTLGQSDICIVTEGINMGTSRNTGSDKQTYYKLTTAGNKADSVKKMASEMFKGGCMHGDIALIEAALSARSFFKLVNIGVPFPHNTYGEYVGYKTDHDPRQRATSAGPLTSRYMIEKLQLEVARKGIKVFDGFQVIAILTYQDEKEGCSRAAGLLALNLQELDRPGMGITLFNCANIIYAAGGPAGLYKDSVYPESQLGATGAALEAGARGVNLTESQFGIASTGFRWNLSGTYQQVLPRYISTAPDGSDEKEFLQYYFPDPGKMLDAIFLKGYQWPFDPRKIHAYGSSLIDILVYNEAQVKGRKVFLDYTRNSSWGSSEGDMDFSLLGTEAYTYLEKSDALFGTPIDRLSKMNQPAIDLFSANGVKLDSEYLEIAVCAQHNNGGLTGDIWWESNIRGFFPVGEVNGTFGVYRPGGSALNSTQVGSLRAAQYICANGSSTPPAESFLKLVDRQVRAKIDLLQKLARKVTSSSNVMVLRERMQERMTRAGGHIRSLAQVEAALCECLGDYSEFTSDIRLGSRNELASALRNRDILITQYAYLFAIKEYILKGGSSRGSYLVCDDNGELPDASLPDYFKFRPYSRRLNKKVCEVELAAKSSELACKAHWSNVRQIPDSEDWFESVWSKYRTGGVFSK